MTYLPRRLRRTRPSNGVITSVPNSQIAARARQDEQMFECRYGSMKRQIGRGKTLRTPDWQGRVTDPPPRPLVHRLDLIRHGSRIKIIPRGLGKSNSFEIKGHRRNRMTAFGP